MRSAASLLAAMTSTGAVEARATLAVINALRGSITPSNRVREADFSLSSIFAISAQSSKAVRTHPISLSIPVLAWGCQR
jgi:hypothetical protein